MLADIQTILWKEMHELVLHRPAMRGGWIGLLVLLGMFGVVIPLQSGPEWISSPANLAIWAWVPYLLVGGLVADSFAGERERHTLETLLASRLPDTAILLGKVTAAMLYGWGLTLVSILLSLVTVNVAHGEGQLLMFPATIGWGSVLLSFLVALLAAGVGILISLRSGSVRQAQQAFNVVLLLFFLPLLLRPLLPEEMQAAVVNALMGANVQAILLGAVVVLAVIDLVILAVAKTRFQRAKLILD